MDHPGAEVANYRRIPISLMFLYLTIRRLNVEYGSQDWAPFFDKMYSSGVTPGFTFVFLQLAGMAILQSMPK